MTIPGQMSMPADGAQAHARAPALCTPIYSHRTLAPVRKLRQYSQPQIVTR